jgi:hypothetical protein
MDGDTPSKLSNCVFTMDLRESNRYFLYGSSTYSEIINCIFKDSSILREIIYWFTTSYPSTNQLFELLNSTFQNLTSSCNNSCIFYHTITYPVSRPVTVYNNSFFNISSSYTGVLDSGGLFSYTFNNSTYNFIFDDNIFNGISFSSSSGRGSILYFVGTNISTFSFQDNEFNDINSLMNGTFYLDTLLDASKFTIKNCIFRLCKSSYGGAIYFVGVYLFIFIIIFFYFYFYFFFNKKGSNNSYRMYIWTKHSNWN